MNILDLIRVNILVSISSLPVTLRLQKNYYPSLQPDLCLSIQSSILTRTVEYFKLNTETREAYIIQRQMQSFSFSRGHPVVLLRFNSIVVFEPEHNKQYLLRVQKFPA